MLPVRYKFFVPCAVGSGRKQSAVVGAGVSVPCAAFVASGYSWKYLSGLPRSVDSSGAARRARACSAPPQDDAGAGAPTSFASPEPPSASPSGGFSPRLAPPRWPTARSEPPGAQRPQRRPSPPGWAPTAAAAAAAAPPPPPPRHTAPGAITTAPLPPPAPAPSSIPPRPRPSPPPPRPPRRRPAPHATRTLQAAPRCSTQLVESCRAPALCGGEMVPEAKDFPHNLRVELAEAA